MTNRVLSMGAAATHPAAATNIVPAAARQIAEEAIINISALRLRTFIGFNDEERAKQQDVVISASIRHRVSQPVFDDRVEAAMNYKNICKAIIHHVENGRFLLLEKLVGDVLAICCDDPAVLEATVTIDKPHALRFADSVSVTMTSTRTD